MNEVKQSFVFHRAINTPRFISEIINNKHSLEPHIYFIHIPLHIEMKKKISTHSVIIYARCQHRIIIQ